MGDVRGVTRHRMDGSYLANWLETGLFFLLPGVKVLKRKRIVASIFWGKQKVLSSA